MYVEDWLEVFPREQIYFVHFETLISNPEDVMDSLFAFIGLHKIGTPVNYSLSYLTIFTS